MLTVPNHLNHSTRLLTSTMQCMTILALIAFIGSSTANPLPEPAPGITSSALARRGAAKVNQPITDAEMAALQAGGLTTTGTKVKRDKVMNCGHLVTGYGGSNGHGKWVPVADFADIAHEFCESPLPIYFQIDVYVWVQAVIADICWLKGSGYQGTEIMKGHETSDTYGVKLSNGKAGNVVSESPHADPI